MLIRPYRDGLILHQMFYANEVRAFDEVDTGATGTFRDIERELAVKLINELTSAAFDSAKYRDEYVDRVKLAVEQKIAGQEVAAVGEVPKAEIIDLFEALKQSLAEVTTKGDDQELRPRPPEKAKPRSDDDVEKKTG